MAGHLSLHGGQSISALKEKVSSQSLLAIVTEKGRLTLVTNPIFLIIVKEVTIAIKIVITSQIILFVRRHLNTIMFRCYAPIDEHFN